MSPTNIFDFYAVGPVYAQTVSVSEAGYTATFTTITDNPASSCSGIVNVTPLANPGVFSITPVAPGTCLFEFEDQNKNQSGGVYVEVTTSQVITE